MSETDKEAIRIVKDLQKNIRNTTIALVSIFALALLTAVFWGGKLDNQVDTNTENIKKLSDVVNKFVSNQTVINENVATEDDIKDIDKLLQATNYNLMHLSWWAETKGYTGLPRGIKDKENGL